MALPPLQLQGCGMVRACGRERGVRRGGVLKSVLVGYRNFNLFSSSPLNCRPAPARQPRQLLPQLVHQAVSVPGVHPPTVNAVVPDRAAEWRKENRGEEESLRGWGRRAGSGARVLLVHLHPRILSPSLSLRLPHSPDGRGQPQLAVGGLLVQDVRALAGAQGQGENARLAKIEESERGGSVGLMRRDGMDGLDAWERDRRRARPSTLPEQTHAVLHIRVL